MNFVSPGTSVTPAPDRLLPVSISWSENAYISALLTEQGDLTAVERFSQLVDESEGTPRGNRYNALLPASPPGPGQQLAFEVDLDRCSGCKACVAACHALNGLDEGETWREVGLLIGGPPALPVLQHVTSSCHHCLDPACLNACPVDAYEKDPITGIVRHLDDQCIGCRYCTLACPYDAPRYHEAKGIVRKCDMCADRLREGEAPACVAACPHEAIRIRVVDAAEVADRAEVGAFLPGTIDPRLTRPTTVYHSRASMDPASVVAADANSLEPDHAHWPLVVMLVLTQLSAGGLAIELMSRLASGAGVVPGFAHISICLSLGLVGLAASVLHLGRPLYAYRAILGVRHSWLSREVLAFGLFAKLAAAFALMEWWGRSPSASMALLSGASTAGAAGVACSVMVYHAVRRPFWQARIGAVKFAGTALVLGLSAGLAAIGLSGDPTGSIPVIAASLAISSAAKIRFEMVETFRGRRVDAEVLDRSLLIMLGPLRRVTAIRWGLGLAGGIALPGIMVVASAWAMPGVVTVAAVLALIASIGGELAERALFFSAVSRPKMPGGLAS